ncbi:unnamed protein product [Phytophthora lilii]|uniref:Unnamed protein product n=1 Tax=Phytophthora lilii TaxID=2077276 RepID=A0A9W6TNM1_9STRA|nr:unnamed protein product [Phytophthora lilii]
MTKSILFEPDDLHSDPRPACSRLLFLHGCCQVGWVDHLKISKKKQEQESGLRLNGVFVHIWNSVFSRKGLIGVESEHFSTLLGRGDVKVIPGAGIQSIQALAVRPKDKNAGGENPSVTQEANTEQWGSYRAFQKWKHAITIVLFILWGLIVLLLHVLAAQRAANYDVVGCRSITRPWFLNGKELCSDLVYDCYNRNTSSPDENSFDKLDHVALAKLAIIHCPDLHIPRF